MMTRLSLKLKDVNLYVKNTILPERAPKIGAFKNCSIENIEPTKPPNRTDVTGSFAGIESHSRNPSTPERTDL